MNSSELDVHIPSATASACANRLDVQDKSTGECFETNIEDINDIIKSLSQNLSICDRKFNRESTLSNPSTDTDSHHTQSCKTYNKRSNTAGNTSSNSSTHHSNCANQIDPVVFPEVWWDTGIKYVFEWLRQIFLERISVTSNKLLQEGKIYFVCWRPYDTKVTKEAVSSSLALLLKPWTSSEKLVSNQETLSKNEYIPTGIQQRQEEGAKELQLLMESANRVIKTIQSESAKYTQVNPPLSEILSSCSHCMKVSLSLDQKHQFISSDYRTETRYNAIVTAKAIAIIQKWILERSIELVCKRIRQYQFYQSEIETQFNKPIQLVQEQRDKFTLAWDHIRNRYDQFIKAKGLKQKDEGSSLAMDVLFQSNRGGEFSIDSIKLFKNYIHHIKNLVYSNGDIDLLINKSTEFKKKIMATSQSCGLGDNREPSSTLCGEPIMASMITDSFLSNHIKGKYQPTESANPVKELRGIYDRRKRELSEINRELNYLRSKFPEELTPSDLEKIESLQERRKQVAQFAETSISLLRDYSTLEDHSVEVEDHNRWIISLDQLESSLEQCIKEWSIVYGKKFNKQAQLEEEIKQSVCAIIRNTYCSFDRDTNQTLYQWNCKQQQTDKNRDMHTRQLCMERHIAQEWLSGFERKLIHFNNPLFGRLISEFKAIHEMIVVVSENLFKLYEFIECFQDLIYLWKMVYSINEQEN